MTNEPPAGKVSPATYPHPRSTASSISPLIYKESFLAKEPKLAKVVIDTSVYISAIIFGGRPEQVLSLIKDKKVSGFTSPKILLELSRKLNIKFGWNEEKIKLVIKNLTRYIQMVNPNVKLKVVKQDPKDNKILECAVAGDANYIVTGDKHLLKLRQFEGIKIVTPADFLRAVK